MPLDLNFFYNFVFEIGIAIIAGSLLIDMERNIGRKSSSSRHQRHAGHRQRLDDWHVQQSFSDDEEFYCPNKIYAHRF